jgi:hypothetical protein
MRLLLIALALLGLSSSAFSQTTATGNIISVRTGWDVESFAVVIDAPIVNPATCPNPDGYISAMNFRGYRTHYEAVLTAFGADVPITVTVHNGNGQCFMGRPRIIGISIGR